MKKIFRKIKKNWQENRVLFVLTMILIICMVLISIVVIDYFLGTSKDKYGERLEGIKKVEITNKKISELENKISEDEQIATCKIKQIGKMIYIDIIYNAGISLVEAQGKAQSSIELFSEEELKFYDINYTLTQKGSEGNDGFIIMGARNVNGSGVVWNNNTPFIDEVEE